MQNPHEQEYTQPANETVTPEAFAHRTDLIQQAEVVLEMIEDGESDATVDTATGLLVQETNSGYESGAIVKQDAEEAILVGELSILRHHGDATPYQLAQSPHELLADTLVTIQATEGMQQLHTLVESMDDAGEIKNETRSAEAFINERLHKNEKMVDLEGVPRPTFHISGHEVIFRNRQEMPLIAGRSVRVVHPELTPPLPIEIPDSDGNFSPIDTAPMRAYNNEHTESKPGAHETLVVTNTLEGMVGAAKEICTNNEQRTQLDALTSLFEQKKYNEPASLDAMDTILASISVDDDGHMLDYYNTDGYALALSALAGDSEASRMVAEKVSVLRAEDSQRLLHRSEVNRTHMEQTEGEPLPMEKIVLVHSTSHDIERDANGNIILTSAAQKRTDMLPRASLHFTLNSRVEDNDGGSWALDNKIIVANLARAVDASGRMPSSLDGVDTWFNLNPGEHVTLPGAIVIEPRTSGVLFESHDGRMSYLAKESYSSDEKAEINTLAREVGLPDDPEQNTTSVLRDIVLRQAMSQEGAPFELQDKPSSGGHGMSNDHLATAIHKTAANIGASWGSHFNSGAAAQERVISNAMMPPNDDSSDRFSGLYEVSPWHAEAQFKPDGWVNPSTIDLEVRRQYVFSGYLPARPVGYSTVKDTANQPPFDMVF